MRQLITRTWCDNHETASDADRIPATVVRVFQILPEAKPRQLDLCEACDKELFGRLFDLDAVMLPTMPGRGYALTPPQTTVEPAAKPKPKGASSEVNSKDPAPCEICGDMKPDRQGLIKHIYSKHAGVPYNQIPREYRTVCPHRECQGEAFASGAALQRHLTRVHDEGMLDKAYEAAREFTAATGASDA